MMDRIICFAVYLTCVNILAFALYGLDKKKARSGTRRISERTLFLAAMLGGAAGAWIGMKFFRHKTRKWYFRFGIPLILIAEVAVIVFVFICK